MDPTPNEFNRLPGAGRKLIVRKYAMLFACDAYQRADPGGDPDAAFARAGRVWSAFGDAAFDFLAVSAAVAEDEIAANWRGVRASGGRRAGKLARSTPRTSPARSGSPPGTPRAARTRSAVAASRS